MLLLQSGTHHKDAKQTSNDLGRLTGVFTLCNISNVAGSAVLSGWDANTVIKPLEMSLNNPASA